MDFADTLSKASFGGLVFPYTGVEVKGSLDHYVHKYIHRPGGEVEELGRHLYKVDFDVHFDTNSRILPDYQQRLAELVSLGESGKTLPLVIPTRGVRAMKAKLIDWSASFTAKVRSGEHVRFSFLEDSADQFSAYQIVQFQALSLGGYAPRLADAAAKINEPGIFDKLLEALNRFERAVAEAELQVAKVLASVEAVLSACGAILELAAMANPLNHLAFYMLLDVFDAALTLRSDISGASRIVDKWFVGSTMSITEVSVAIHGDPSHVDDLLNLNNFDDLMRIHAGAVVNYYAT